MACRDEELEVRLLVKERARFKMEGFSLQGLRRRVAIAILSVWHRELSFMEPKTCRRLDRR